MYCFCNYFNLFKTFGRKIDNIKYKVKWKIFFIPLYETLYKIILFIILIFEISSSNFLGVVIPIILDETWTI